MLLGQPVFPYLPREPCEGRVQGELSVTDWASGGDPLENPQLLMGTWLHHACQDCHVVDLISRRSWVFTADRRVCLVVIVVTGVWLR